MCLIRVFYIQQSDAKKKSSDVERILNGLESQRKESGMNKFRHVIAAVMLSRGFFREGKEKKYVHVCVSITCQPNMKGCGLSRLKVDVSHVAC